ncbi:hypothetical protein AX774_g2446 [Zancudomyces culisetae]|uniref:Uncharacterized protein n=1 Tax=Zancudomyces culisetae TaxID=1213189 RepID=A0A1R1PSS4_ZANCU|nr:hypothetical protein AX774_g2446 [Zancudomyces culisetae]|eukprot:OMH84046.1 hypothetical protein AX774_g2446 [Zancudomyces culisetae]
MKPEACLMFIKALYMGYKQPLLPGKPESGTGNILTGFTDLCIEPLVKFLATLTKLLLCDAICTCRAAKYISSLPGFPKIIEDNVDDASVSSQTSPDIRSRSFSGSFRGEAGKSNAGGSVIYKHDSVKNSNKEVYVISSDEGDDPPASPKKKQKLSHYTTKTSPKTKEQDSLCPQCRVPFYQSTNTAAIDDFQSTFFCGPMFLNIDKHKLDICHRSMLARIKRLLYIGKRSSAHSSLDNYFLSLYKQTYFLLLFLHRLFANIRKIPSNFNPQVFEQLPLNDPYFVYDVDLLSIDIYCRLLTFFGKSSPSYFITDGSLSSETSHDISGQDGPSLVELVDDFMLDLNNSSSHYQDSSTPDPELNSHQTTDNQKLWSFLLPGFHSTSTCPFYSTQSLFNYNRSPQQFSGDPSLNLNVHRTTSTYQKSPVSMFSTRMSQTYGEREELLLPNCLFLEFANLSNKLYALDFSTQQILINRPDMYLACCQKKYLASIDEGRLLKSKWITNIHSLVDIFDALKH